MFGWHLCDMHLCDMHLRLAAADGMLLLLHPRKLESKRHSHCVLRCNVHISQLAFKERPKAFLVPWQTLTRVKQQRKTFLRGNTARTGRQPW